MSLYNWEDTESRDDDNQEGPRFTWTWVVDLLIVLLLLAGVLISIR